MLEHLRQLIEFNYWARDRLLAAVEALTPEQYDRDLGSSFPSVGKTLLHLYMAEWVWYQRTTGHSPTTWPDISAIVDLDSLKTAWHAQEAQYRAFAAALDDAKVASIMPYTLMNGDSGRATFAQVISHLVNHGTYHRGQVTTMLRQLGAKPAKPMDLIAFYREQR